MANAGPDTYVDREYSNTTVMDHNFRSPALKYHILMESM
jgi:hypothetical protein